MSGTHATRRPLGACRRLAASSMVVLLIASTTGAAEPGPTPHRYVPARGLVAYVEFDGLAPHAEAWRATAAHAMLARTPAGAMMREIGRQVADRFLKMVPGAKLTGADLVALQEHVIDRGFAIATHRHRDDVQSVTVVLNGLGRPGIRERFDRFLELLVAPAPPEKMPAPTRLRDRSVYQLTRRRDPEPVEFLRLEAAAPADRPQGSPIPWLAWWFEKDDLILISVPWDGPAPMPEPAGGKPAVALLPEQVATVLDVLGGKQPDARTHPAYVAALSEGTDIRGFDADGLFFIDSGTKVGLLGGLLEGRGGIGVAGLLGGSLHGADPDPFPAAPAADPGPTRMPSTDLAPTPSADGSTAKERPATIPTEGVAAAPSPTAGGATEPVGVRPPPSSVIPTPGPAARPDVADGLPPLSIGPGLLAQPRAADSRKKEMELGRLLGLDGAGRVVGRWGFQGKALLADVRIEAPSPRKGLVGLLDQPAFEKDRIPQIPRATAAFVVDSFDPVAVYARVAELAKSIEPEAGALIDQLERAARDATGLRLREDLLGRIGATWCLIPVANADRPGGKDDLDPTAFALVGTLKDADGFARVLDTLATRANDYLRQRESPQGPPAAAGGIADEPTLAVERLPAPARGYRLVSPSRMVFWLNEQVQPTILVGGSSFALAIHPDRAREALASDAGGDAPWQPTGELAKAFECLPAKLTFLSVGDPSTSSVPGLIAGLPGFVQLMSTGLAGASDELAGASPDFLTLIGVPGAGQFRLRIDPDKVPKEEELRSQLFPSVLAAAVDDRGIRFIAREAFPMACSGKGTFVKSKVKWTGAKGLQRTLELGLKWPRAE